ncbi:hypothetical protein D3C72_2286150 [compost metagenome]
MRLRTRFSASDRAFCARSLRIVHLHEMLACSSGLPPFFVRKLARVVTVSSTNTLGMLITVSSSVARATTMSGVMV